MYIRLKSAVHHVKNNTRRRNGIFVYFRDRTATVIYVSFFSSSPSTPFPSLPLAVKNSGARVPAVRPSVVIRTEFSRGGRTPITSCGPPRWARPSSSPFRCLFYRTDNNNNTIKTIRPSDVRPDDVAVPDDHCDRFKKLQYSFSLIYFL